MTLFSEVLTRSRDLMTEGMAVLVTAEARLDNDNLRLTARRWRGWRRPPRASARASGSGWKALPRWIRSAPC